MQVPTTPGDVTRWNRRRFLAGVTGEDGKATFESVPVGRYVVLVLTLGTSGLIDPASNPLAPPPLLTVASEDEKVAVEIEVWRGSLFRGEEVVDRGGVPHARVILRGLDGQPTMEFPLDVLGRAERLLVPGRWEADLVVPPGYLIVDVVWNGESLPGHTVRFDVREDPRPQIVSWYLSASCLITGRMSEASGRCVVPVVATLVEPGPWIAAALARGGSTFQVVPNQEWPDPCVYRLWLPDGEWTVRPQGEDLLVSEPESVDVAMVPGETRSLDFLLTMKDRDERDGRKPLVVRVLAPDGLPLAGAAVEVWPPGERSLSAVPLRTDVTGKYGGSVRFRGLAAGSYRVAAGRADFLEGTAEAPDYDPKAEHPPGVVVTLREGATLHARAVDEEGRPIREVELSYLRLGELPRTALANEGIASAKRSGTALSDATGHLEIPGLYSGDYRVEARMTGEQSAVRFVVLRQGTAKHSKSIEVHLTEPARSDVDLLLLPAASLTGSLACSDRGTMPATVSFRIFPAGSPIADLWQKKDLEAGAVSAPDDLVLGGDGLDRYHLGPLAHGEYLLAARPSGQDYWSWASNGLVPEGAATYPVEEASTLDTGVVEIECGPLLAVVPEILSKEAVPDLRLGAVRGILRPAAGVKGIKDVEPDAETHADRAFLRSLPEGKFRAAVTVEHPYLVPSSVSAPEQKVDLARGRLAEIRVTFERLGGLVDVRGMGKAARLTAGEGSPSVRPLTDGKALFPGTLPGAYRVEMCADPACSAVTATWERVEVMAGRTTFVH